MRLREVLSKRIDREGSGLSLRASIHAAIAANIDEPGATRVGVRSHERAQAGERPESESEGGSDE